MSNLAYLSLGSNLDRERCYPEAVRLLATLGKLAAVSPVYETEPVGMTGVGNFFNGAVLLVTDLGAEKLKSLLVERIEDVLGRTRTGGLRFESRTIDVDIALWNDDVRRIRGRQIPDPGILRFLYLARPLADIAPDLSHPLTGQSLAEIARQLERTGALPTPRPDIILEY